RDLDLGWAEGAQVAAKLQEPGAGLARLDVPIQLVFGQVVGGGQVPHALGVSVGGAQAAPRRPAGFVALAADRGPRPARPGLEVQRTELIGLCRCLHRWIYADIATMPRVSFAALMA